MGWIPPEEYVKTISQATMFGCLYFTNEQGWPIQLLSVYGEVHWQLPGGCTDVGETPWETAVRECAEETGHRFTGPPRLLVTQFIQAHEAWPLPKVGFVFDGGILRDREIDEITLDPEEHSEFRVKPLDAWRKIMAPEKFVRLGVVAAARQSGEHQLVIG
ncbi:NUDIX hydrolase [Streptomyces sp. NBC_01760]|uniref:NUDIX hydrolase n=1 Tax=Streptomyces sp. NBC_01760 TaxID=2975931 RepID=UPI002DDC4129|nr:NUDIX hydrolase [Streptomyces sp. NBC_01760]WSC72191.1 NUDIX hydrolase [Streptomyces sp. NBC_01760]